MAKITIDYDKIYKTAKLGVNRAAIFMGLGINAASDPNFNNYRLTDVTAIKLIPENVDSKQVKGFKEEFSSWIVGCGLRELIETFSVFLDLIYDASLHVLIYKGKLTQQEAIKFYSNFISKGLREKFNILESQFGIKYQHSDYLITINQARNCLTHRRGIVGEKDYNKNSNLTIKWLGRDFIIKPPSGNIKTHDVSIPLSEPIFIEKDTLTYFKYVERSLTFEKGKIIKVSPRYLAEICVFVDLVAQFLKKLAIDYAISKGIKSTIE